MEDTLNGIFMALGGILLLLKLRPMVARIAWSVLLGSAVTFALVLSLAPRNLVNINVTHYYLGAKYSFPYSSCYRVISAAMERPQVNMRDLDNPARMDRETDEEQRAYYIDLMRGEQVPFDPLAPTSELKQTAISTGAIRNEARLILEQYLPPDQIEPFRRDVVEAEKSYGWKREITSDYGYNGSPFYEAVRHLDPTLYFPFSAQTAILNMIVQIMGMIAVVWLVGAAFGVPLESRLAMLALLFASWDFVGYLLTGLICVGLWLPIALAVYFAQRQKSILTGASIAWAGLIKLFPFSLVLPALGLLVTGWRSSVTMERRYSPRVWGMRILGAVVISGLTLILISSFGGRSWGEFISKIVHQFQSESYLLNSVSMSRFLMSLGITDHVVPPVVSGFVLLLILVMVFGSNTTVSIDRFPIRLLVIASAFGLVMRTTWFSYYFIAPLLLLPIYAQKHRLGSALAAIGLAASFLLPDFDSPSIWTNPWIHPLKLIPYVAIPIWFIWVELKEARPNPKVMKIIAVLGAVCFVLISLDGWRMAEVRTLDRLGGQHLDQGNGVMAAEEYARLRSLDPGNAIATLNQGIAMAVIGRTKDAGEFMAKATEMAPDSVVCLENYGLLLIQTGDYVKAGFQLDRAMEIAPNSAELLYHRARLLVLTGNPSIALVMIKRAQELAPGRQEISALVHQLTGGDSNQ